MHFTNILYIIFSSFPRVVLSHASSFYFMHLGSLRFLHPSQNGILFILLLSVVQKSEKVISQMVISENDT